MATDYLKKMQYALEKRNITKALLVVQEALMDETQTEQTCANLIIIAHTFGLPIFEFVPQFLEKYPNSLYPIRVLLAQILCDSGNFDDATSEARYFLRIVQQNEKIGQMDDEHLLEYTMRAFLLTTTIYVTVGARSYAERVLHWAKSVAPENWQVNFDKELNNLQVELSDEYLSNLNDKWEAFFTDGAHYNELYQQCAENRYTEIAIRLRLLQGEREQNVMQPIDQREITRVVMIDEKGNYLLG